MVDDSAEEGSPKPPGPTPSQSCAPRPQEQHAEQPLPTATEELRRSELKPAEPDAKQRRRLTEAAVGEHEARTRMADAEAMLALAEARKAEAEVESARIAAAQANDDRKLRGDIANKVFTAALVQVAIADAGFVVYGFARGWGEIEPGTMNAWLGATVIQVIAVALVIARSLFPPR